MSDQQAPTQDSVDTSAVAGPNEAPGTAQDQPQESIPAGYIPEDRYKNLQAEYTRDRQAIKEAEYREQWYQALVTSDDPDIRRQAADVLGIEIEQPEQDYSELDELTEGEEPYVSRSEWEAFQQQQQQQMLEAQQAMENEYVVDQAKSQLDEMGFQEGPDDIARTFIADRALSLPRLPPQPGQPRQGLLDVKTAHAEFEALSDYLMKNWAKTKRAPYVSPGGLPANEVPDPGHGTQARINRAMQSLHNSIGDE